MSWTVAAGLGIFLVFNLPVMLILVRLPFIADLGEALKEKGPIGGAEDTTSYSRVTGLVGAVILTSFFWAVGNVVLFKALTAVSDIQPVVGGVGQLFLIGAALFLPYAFNQIKSAVGASRIAAALAPAAPIAVPVAVAAPPADPAPKGPGLNITVANLSSGLDDATFAGVVEAIGMQVSRDFQPEWGLGASLTPQRLAVASGTVNIDNATDAVIYVGDVASDPTTGTAGAFGYHATNFGQIPYAFIYLDVCAKAGEAWTCTLSHEVLELLADPTAVVTISGPSPTTPGRSVTYDLEVCDPTQGDSYRIGPVEVSNFVHRSYFRLTGGAGSTNHLGLPLEPFGVRPGGYFQYEDATGAQTVDGPKVDANRLAARAMMQAHRRNARRNVRRDPAVAARH